VIGNPSESLSGGYRSAAARFQGGTTNDANNNMMGGNARGGSDSQLDGSMQQDQ